MSVSCTLYTLCTYFQLSSRMCTVEIALDGCSSAAEGILARIYQGPQRISSSESSGNQRFSASSLTSDAYELFALTPIMASSKRSPSDEIATEPAQFLRNQDSCLTSCHAFRPQERASRDRKRPAMN